MSGRRRLRYAAWFFLVVNNASLLANLCLSNGPLVLLSLGGVLASLWNVEKLGPR